MHSHTTQGVPRQERLSTLMKRMPCRLKKVEAEERNGTIQAVVPGGLLSKTMDQRNGVAFGIRFELPQLG
jgi:hypothetical protein